MKFKLFLIFSVLLSVSFSQGVYAQTPENPLTTTTRKQTVPAKRQATPSSTVRSSVPNPSPATPSKTYQNTAKQVDTVKNTDMTLNGQYQFLLSRSKNINGYKLVNPYRLTTVWKSVIDTLSKERLALTKLQAKVAEQEKTIGGLQTEVKGNETEVIDSNAKSNEINFLGLSFTKGTYNILVWSIIGILAIALFIVVARSAKSITEAKHRTQLYDEISNEYQAFKAKSVEKERKLARELQDERNKLDDLNSRR